MISSTSVAYNFTINTSIRLHHIDASHRDLPDIDFDLCSICGHPYLNDNVDIDTCYLDPMLGHLTWFGYDEDEDVGNFIE